MSASIIGRGFFFNADSKYFVISSFVNVSFVLDFSNRFNDFSFGIFVAISNLSFDGFVPFDVCLNISHRLHL